MHLSICVKVQNTLGLEFFDALNLLFSDSIQVRDKSRIEKRMIIP